MTCHSTRPRGAHFETDVDDGYCTNAACFELKTEAAEVIHFEQEERAAKAARAVAPPAVDKVEGDDNDDAIDETFSDRFSAALEKYYPAPGQQRDTRADARGPDKADDQRQCRAQTGRHRQIDRSPHYRASRASWRTALARALAGNAEHARTIILVAAMSGKLSQIKADMLTSRAGLLVDPSFPDFDYSAQIAAIRALPDARAVNVLSVISGAYAKDVLGFAHVADLAKIGEIDLRDSWQIDQAFLEQYTKDELKFIAQGRVTEASRPPNLKIIQLFWIFMVTPTGIEPVFQP